MIAAGTGPISFKHFVGWHATRNYYWGPHLVPGAQTCARGTIITD